MGICSRDLVEDKAYRFKKRLEELKSEEYYSEQPKELVALFDKVIIQIIDGFSNIDENDQISIKRVNTLLTFYHQALDELEHIRENNVPVEMLPLIEHIMEKLQVKTTFIFRPNPLYNFSYYPISRFVQIIMKAQKYEPLVQQDIAVISFPCCERNSALLSCTLAHEIGHHLNEFFGISKEIEPQILVLLDKPYLEKYVSVFIETLSLSRGATGDKEVTLEKFYPKDQLIPVFTEEFASIIRKWLDEIVSDIIGLYLFGPSFLFAFAEFCLTSQDIDKYSETHPPLFIRIRNLMLLFNELKLGANFEEYVEVKKRLTYYQEVSKRTFEAAVTSKPNSIKNLILERGIVSVFDLARKGVQQKLKPKLPIYDVEECKQAVYLFRNLIPGNEIRISKDKSKPINPISILNASWIVRINYIEDLYTLLPKNEKYNVRNTLDGLTLKALELQEFHSRMVQEK
jgi:predicted Zn-dependent protease with MMP-like domain